MNIAGAKGLAATRPLFLVVGCLGRVMDLLALFRRDKPGSSLVLTRASLVGTLCRNLRKWRLACRARRLVTRIRRLALSFPAIQKPFKFTFIGRVGDLTVQHTLGGQHVIGQVTHFVVGTAEDRHLQTVPRSEMNVHHRDDDIVMMMLLVHQLVREISRFVIVDETHNGEPPIVGGRAPVRIVTQQLAANQIANRLAAVRISLMGVDLDRTARAAGFRARL